MTLLQIGDYALLFGLPPAVFFTFGYMFTAPWYKSPIGVMFVSMGLASVTFSLVVLLSVFLGTDYPGREIVRIAGYIAHALALYLLCVVWLIERRSANPTIPIRRKEKTK